MKIDTILFSVFIMSLLCWCVSTNYKESNRYTETMLCVEDNGKCILETSNGNMFVMDSINDVHVGDYVNVIMDSNGTDDDITDDEIVDVRSSGFTK